jgi:predicted transcriptional regulator
VRTATIQIRKDSRDALAELGDAFVRSWTQGQAEGDIFEFDSPKTLFRTLSPKRWELIERLQATGPVSLRGLARLLGRDVKRVHEDVSVLLQHGLVERDETGKLLVPYDVIHIDFDLRSAAA